jgi:hypothetical protein
MSKIFDPTLSNGPYSRLSGRWVATCLDAALKASAIGLFDVCGAAAFRFGKESVTWSLFAGALTGDFVSLFDDFLVKYQIAPPPAAAAANPPVIHNGYRRTSLDYWDLPRRSFVSSSNFL